MAKTKNDTTRELSAEKHGEPDEEGRQNFIVTEIDYVKGRGYFAVVRYEGRKDEGGWVSRAFLLAVGSRSQLLEPATRFSAKRLADLTIPPEVQASLRAKVLESIQQDAARRAERATNAAASKAARSESQ